MELITTLIGDDYMCEIYGFCGSHPTRLNQYTGEFWLHSRYNRDGFGYYLADKDTLYLNPKPAIEFINELNKFNFESQLALCHIRFKTHGDASIVNCHPFTKNDNHSVKWSLIHNGYILSETPELNALGTLQTGNTDSERILLSLIESINSFYEYSLFYSKEEFFQWMYASIENTLCKLASLGKVNLIFTDGLTHNMYVFMNDPGTLFYLPTKDGYHFSTTRLSSENWLPVEPFTLHIVNNGSVVNY
jgi:predicted glutamine amidotransferase